MSISSLMDWGNSPTSLDLRTRELIEPLYLYQGDSFILSMSFNETDEDIPYDLSGYAFTVTIKRSIVDKLPVKKIVMGSKLSIGGDLNEILTINDVVDFNAGSYILQIRGIAPTGQIVTFIKSKKVIVEGSL